MASWPASGEVNGRPGTNNRPEPGACPETSLGSFSILAVSRSIQDRIVPAVSTPALDGVSDLSCKEISPRLEVRRDVFDRYVSCVFIYVGAGKEEPV